jgi:hypothetical protein
VGVVGGSVVADTYYGGAYVYPDSVVVPMSPTRTLPPQEAQGFPYTQQQVTPAKPVYQHKAVPVPVASSRGNS